MSIVSDLQKLLAAKVAELDRAPTIDAPTAVPAPTPSLAKVAEAAAVDVATTIGATYLHDSIGASNVVKIITAAQQLILTIDEVKTDIKNNSPEVWAQIVSAFPALGKPVL